MTLIVIIVIIITFMIFVSLLVEFVRHIRNFFRLSLNGRTFPFATFAVDSCERVITTDTISIKVAKFE
jgi:tellurite resistance protein TehA-like permease